MFDRCATVVLVISIWFPDKFANWMTVDIKWIRIVLCSPELLLTSVRVSCCSRRHYWWFSCVKMFIGFVQILLWLMISMVSDCLVVWCYGIVVEILVIFVWAERFCCDWWRLFFSPLCAYKRVCFCVWTIALLYYFWPVFNFRF